ncbi:UDP-glycosyltransferase [Nymphaea thermarum]|nr:UDP-glycosyltransferase [Nymphaea thermarum]
MKIIHNREEPHVVMVPSAGIGHLNPMIELAKTLLSCHSLTVSFFTVSGQFPTSAITNLSELSNNINCISLPAVDTSDLPPNGKVLTAISAIMRRSVQPLRNLLPKIQPISAFILDMFCTDLLDVATELELPVYILFASNATALSLFLYTPILHEEVVGEYKDLQDKVKLPGCLPFRGTELVHPMQDRQDVEYEWYLHHCRRYKEATGIMINTVDELEPNAIRALMQGRENGDNIPPLYPVGPLVKIVDESDKEEIGEDNCLKWLDKQPRGSVLFVCLGSGGTLTQKQLTELAWGLELSGHRFLWVARKPYSVADAAFFSAGRNKDDDVASFLPEGFVKRTADVGMVVPEWAPQVKVLSHEAIGGFLSHCGWNSTLESIARGVPMIAWPLYAEQRMNSRMLVEEMGVAVGVSYEKGVVQREEVAQAVRLLMDGVVGEKLRKRASELSKVVTKALEGKGLSHQRIARLVGSWMENNQKPHVVMIPNAGIGHLNPMVELAKTLLSLHSLTLSFLTVSVDNSDISPSTGVVTGISVLIKRSVEPLRNFLPKIQPIAALILDMFCTDLLDVATELELPVYILFTSNATALSLFLYTPILHEEVVGEYKDLQDKVKLPGCLPFRGTELVHPTQDRQDVEYEWYLHHRRRYKEATGIMINTVEELEPAQSAH